MADDAIQRNDSPIMEGGKDRIGVIHRRPDGHRVINASVYPPNLKSGTSPIEYRAKSPKPKTNIHLFQAKALTGQCAPEGQSRACS